MPGNPIRQKITPFLWFDGKAEEAAKSLYLQSFKDSQIGGITRYGEGGPGPEGTVMTVTFRVGRTRIHCAERWSRIQIH